MHRLLPLFGLALTLAGLAQPALAQGTVRDSYCTQISDNDKYASDGFALTDAGSILRQDRANFHRFGTADGPDENDNTFGSTRAREALPGMLNNGNTSTSVLRQIVRNYPYVCVDIYRNAITVFVVD